MDLGLKGKRAIVTGGTRGIGRAIAEVLAAEGANIAICARKAAEVEEAVAALKARGVQAHGAVVDIAEAEAYRAWIEGATEAMGGLDIFVANVSAGGGMDSEKNWWKNFEVDVLHTVRGCETLMEHLKKSGQGSVVIISSTNAIETFAAPICCKDRKSC